MEYNTNSNLCFLMQYLKPKWILLFGAIIATVLTFVPILECLQIVKSNNYEIWNSIYSSIGVGYLTGLLVYILSVWVPFKKNSELQLSIVVEELRYIQDYIECDVIKHLSREEMYGVWAKKETKMEEINTTWVELSPINTQFFKEYFLPLKDKIHFMYNSLQYFEPNELKMFYKLETCITFKHLTTTLEDNNTGKINKNNLIDMINGIYDFYEILQELRSSLIKRTKYYVGDKEVPIKITEKLNMSVEYKIDNVAISKKDKHTNVKIELTINN